MDLTIQPCLACIAGFHWECRTLQEDDCCCTDNPIGIPNQRGGPVKEDADVTDPKSTGRKRAAALYPIEPGMVCEWSGLRYACGGKFPIVGCTDRPATHRHHGPDKNTLNNSPGNVHRICVFCHNRWHTLNDPVYDEYFGTDSWLPHDPETKASVDDILKNELDWQSRKVNTPDDE